MTGHFNSWWRGSRRFSAYPSLIESFLPSSWLIVSSFVWNGEPRAFDETTKWPKGDLLISFRKSRLLSSFDFIHMRTAWRCKGWSREARQCDKSTYFCDLIRVWDVPHIAVLNLTLHRMSQLSCLRANANKNASIKCDQGFVVKLFGFQFVFNNTTLDYNWYSLIFKSNYVKMNAIAIRHWTTGCL